VATGSYNPELSIGLSRAIFAYWVALILGVIVYIKRFHDRDKSGWWVLIGLIPVIGSIWLLISQGHAGVEPLWSARDGLIVQGAHREQHG
jgi:uncharacterized membrane protein YhaH (DUF805 family)